MAGYISPFRTTVAASGTKYHFFPQPNTADVFCNPAHCRECWRETHWRKGQTHGA